MFYGNSLYPKWTLHSFLLANRLNQFLAIKLYYFRRYVMRANFGVLQSRTCLAGPWLGYGVM